MLFFTQLIKFSFAKKNLIKNKQPVLFKPIVKGIYKKDVEEIKELKKQLSVEFGKEKLQRAAIMDSQKPEDIYRMMDASFERFFSKRSYDSKNFNFWIQVLGQQNLEGDIGNALNKMKEIGIQANPTTYINLVQAYGRLQNQKQFEFYFDVCIQKFGRSIQLYNALIYSYGRCHEIKLAQKAFNEMVEQGIQPDTIAHTTLINAYYKCGDLQKCWDIFMDVRMGNTSTAMDENIFNLMIEICAHTHDSEKAIGLYNMMSDMEFLNTTYHYNSYIKALASRRDYAQKGLDVFKQMLIAGIPLDSDTIVHSLKACAAIGDVKQAFDILQLMKDRKITNNQYIHNMTIKVYANACKLEFIPESTKEVFIQDAWTQLEIAKQNQWVTSHTLDSMSQVMVNAGRLADLEGLVLPLYDELKVPKTPKTYELQPPIEIMKSESRFLDVIRLKELVLSNNMEPTFNTICHYLEAAIKLVDEDKIIDALEMFQKSNKTPKTQYLKFLGEQDPLPPRLHAILNEFSPKFGLVKDSVFRVQKKDKYIPM